MNVPCAGIIVFDNDNTILVNTDVGNFSFPKGKKHKNETPIQAAWRELEEETGLTQEYVQLIDENYIDEISSKGFVCVRYFIGYLIKERPKITFDKNELENVAWYLVNDALKIEKFKKARKEILEKAYKKYKQKK